VRSAPTVFVDAAHNPHGATALAQALTTEFGFRKVVGVLAVMRDKDAEGILSALEPVFTEVVLTANSSPRGMSADELAGVAKQIYGEDRIFVEPRMVDAIETAVHLSEERADDNDAVSGGGVIVTGSVVTAGEVRSMFGKEPA
jgi:dihydrofolate synthase/folylpolyglutamate synthase